MLVHSVNQRQLHSKVDSEGGQVTSTPRLTCLPTCQHCIEVALRGQHVDLGLDVLVLLPMQLQLKTTLIW